MDIKSVHKYSAPRYPDRLGIDEEPELLLEIPKRWKVSPSALTAFAATMAIGAAWAASGDSAKAKRSVPLVAPIFEHGTGRGTFAGDTATPPVLLAESEARLIITEEAKRAGITLVPDARIVSGLEVPAGSGDKTRVKRMGMVLDGTDAKRRISYEYVSEDDAHRWNMTKLWPRGAADIIRLAITAKRQPAVYAVFYDPSSQAEIKFDKSGHPDRQSMDTYMKRAHTIAREDLRKQVQDFIKWLKSEGVI